MRSKSYALLIIAAGAIAALITVAAYSYLVPTSNQTPHNSNSMTSGAPAVNFVNGRGFDVFPTDSRPYGKTYADWSQLWWIWAQQRPTPQNPLADKTGQYCSFDQNDSNVFFLGGSLGGKVERNCTVSAAKAIMFPTINGEDSFAEDRGAKNVDDLRNTAIAGTNGSYLEAFIDGVPIPNLQDYYVVSSPFNVTLPKDNIWSAPAGQTVDVAAGYYYIVKPLPTGNHELRFAGVKTNIPTPGNPTFENEVIFHLKVE